MSDPRTDNLRTRIAAAIRAVDDMRVCKLSDADIKFIVEAVIRELSEPQRGELVPCPTCDDRQCMDCVLRHQHDRCVNSCPRCGVGRA